jgi:hypothetical protein
MQYLDQDAQNDAYYTNITKYDMRQRARGVYTYCCGVDIEEFEEMRKEYVVARMRQPLNAQDIT